MTTDTAARLNTIDSALRSSRRSFANLDIRTTVSGSAMEELIAGRIESAEDQLKKLQAARRTVALPPADSQSFKGLICRAFRSEGTSVRPSGPHGQ